MATTRSLFGLNGKRSPASLQGISENKVFLFTEEELQTDIQRQVESFQLYARRNNKHSESLPLLDSKRWQAWNANIGARIQDGPRCGLVALKMAADHLRTKSNHQEEKARKEPKMNEVQDEEIQTLLKVARERGWSIQGEMFSAHNLALLASEICGLTSNVLEDGLNINNYTSFKQVLRHLRSGNLILVPYDSDKNHEPCCLGGKKAHWAVIKGYLTPLLSSLSTSNSDEELSLTVSYPTLLSDANEKLKEEERTILLVCQQPKSKRQALWSLHQLFDSNNNLLHADNQFQRATLSSSSSPASTTNPGDVEVGNLYVIPETLEGHLKGLIVLLSPKET